MLGLNFRKKNLYEINDKNVLIVIFNTLCNCIAHSALAQINGFNFLLN